MPVSKDQLLTYAGEIGLDLVGVTTPEPFLRYLEELESRQAHYAGRYAHRLETWRRAARPREAMPKARALVVVGFYYLTSERPPEHPCGRLGRIVAYGHLGIFRRARQVCTFLKAHGHRAVMGLHRKEAAVRAGLGMIGKNGLVLNPRYGAWVAYQTIATDAHLAPDAPFTEDLCGDCDACLRACPSQALYEPRRLDPRRCVTALLTGAEVDEAMRPALKDYLLGCDECLDACPRNRGLAPKQGIEAILPGADGIHLPLGRLLRMSEASFQREIVGPIQERMVGPGPLAWVLRNPWLQALVTAMAKRFLKGREALPETFVHASDRLKTYQRNALIAVANRGERSLLPEVQALRDDAALGPYARWAEERLSS